MATARWLGALEKWRESPVKRWVAALATSSMLATILVVAAESPAVSAPAPLTCKQISREGIDFRLCRGRVTSHDGTVTLDTDVTLPGRGRGPFPLIVMLHGLGGAKQSYECLGEETPGAGGSSPGCKVVEGTGGTYQYNNLWFASRGYAVLNYTARGFHNSKCLNDNKPSKDADDALDPPATYGPSPACMLQLDHVEHEVTDTQYLVGRLVDGTLLEHSDIEIARKIGVTGVSYGGGHTWLLTRRNSWESPRGQTIRVGAAVPIIGFTDLADSLAPNGRARDDVVQTPDAGERGAQAVGVLKDSYVDAFVRALTLTAAEFGALPGYLKAWYARIGNGEPYDDAMVQDALDKLLLGRSAYYVQSARKRTPILAVQAFTDGIFPAIESLRMYARLTDSQTDYPIRVYLGDWGHPIAQNKPGETFYIARLVNRWFGHYLKGRRATPAGFVEARRTTCGESMGRLYRGASWEDLKSQPFVAQGLSLAGVVTTPASDPHAAAVDPDPGQPNAGRCRVTDTAVAPDNLAANVPVPPEGLTMMGLPEVTLTADPSAAEMYVVARLWDVDPTAGEQTLVTRGVWRLGGDEAGQIVVMQLFGNAYRFRPGHEIKLELTADDARAFKNWEQLNAPAPGEIAISSVGLSIPVADATNLVGEAPIPKRTLEAIGPVRVTPAR
jgi:X-Pro dipeptidyl-peptidase (S15 family)/X-Pro dipeptidyl-peptidase C-terminal non-catalytic domain